MNLIDGRKIAAEIRQELAHKIHAVSGRKPGLAFILVGDDPASHTYVRAKKKACADLGIVSFLTHFPITASQEELLHEIARLNGDPQVDGILVQLPLPLHIHDHAVMQAIDPAKDVDGFHPLNMGKLLLGDETGFSPCTPNGIRELLKRSKITVSGKHVVIVGRSNIVGKPLAAILMQKKSDCNATVTLAHSGSHNLAEITKTAEILIVAAGHPHLICKEMVRPGSVVVDVGINRLKDGTLVGDVDFANVVGIASHMTPVPGGVGPMTIAMLLSNTWVSFTRRSLA
jgi:methylenetetrahydrofolate dehydrogenase (NADP+)/methenyltetrahydrofolate cyclohydrolase